MSAHLKPLGFGLLVGTPTDGVHEPPREPASLSRSSAAGRQRLESWFRDHFDMLWRLAARLGVPHANVDDVVQEAFITADRRAGDITAGSERRFLVSTTVKLCANQRRRRDAQLERPVLVEPRAEALDAEQLLARKQLRQLLDAALDALPLEQRTVLVLHELEGYSLAEVASLLEVPPGTVASRLARARSKFSKSAASLRSRWNEHGPRSDDP